MTDDSVTGDSVSTTVDGAAGPVALGTAPQISITGGATPTEIAAIIAVWTSISAPAPTDPPRRSWGAPAAALRSTTSPGTGAWRASALPR